MDHCNLRTSIVVQGATSHNQDRAVAIRLEDALLLVVSDGVGGMGGGAEAADAVICFFGLHGGQFAASADPSIWALALAEVDRIALEDAAAGEATAVVAFVSRGSVCGASVGDSQAWLIDGAKLQDLTERQRRRPLVGSGGAVPTSFGPVPLAGRLLIGTDGLFNYTKRERIVELGATVPIADAAGALLEAARLPSCELNDDISIIVCGPVQTSALD